MLSLPKSIRETGFVREKIMFFKKVYIISDFFTKDVSKLILSSPSRFGIPGYAAR